MKTPSQTSAAIKREAIDSMRQMPYGVLATVDSAGRPHAATVIIVVNADLSIEFITRADTNKYRNLLKNPQVAMAIGSTPPYAFQLRGRVRQVKAAKDVAATMERWAEVGAKLKDIWPPILRLGQAPYAVFRITPKTVTAIDLRSQTLNPKALPFIKLI